MAINEISFEPTLLGTSEAGSGRSGESQGKSSDMWRLEGESSSEEEETRREEPEVTRDVSPASLDYHDESFAKSILYTGRWQGLTASDVARGVQVHASNAGLHTTFGVEFEMQLLHVKTTNRTLLPDDARFCAFDEYFAGDEPTDEQIMGHIRDALVARSLKAAVVDSVPQYWQIGSDASIKSRPDEIGIEVASPAYFYNADALAEVVEAAAVLDRVYRTRVDKSCGLHVHVGQGLRGFRLAHLKAIFAFVVVFEGALEEVHPVHRKTEPGCGYSWPASMRSRLAAAVTDNGRQALDPWKCLRKIYAAKTKVGVAALATTTEHGKMAYHFDQAWRSDGKLTIEFRQHEGTLDGRRAVMWIRTVVGIVRFLERLNARQWLAFLEEHVGKSVKEFGIVELLLQLDLKAEAAFYAKQLDQEGLLPWDLDLDLDVGEDEVKGVVGQARIIPWKNMVSESAKE